MADLAKILGISTSLLCEIEKGKRMIPKKRSDAFETYIFHHWYAMGELVEVVDQEGDNYLWTL